MKATSNGFSEMRRQMRDMILYWFISFFLFGAVFLAGDRLSHDALNSHPDQRVSRSRGGAVG